MALDSIVPAILLVALLIFFVKSNYLRYGDMKFLLAGFALLTAFIMLTAASLTGLFFSLANMPFPYIIIHGFGSLAAWFFVWDAYRGSRRF